jgi:uncharacterized protein (TIGR03067 family)
MRRSVVIALALIVTLPLAAQDKKADADMATMVGNWKVVKAEIGGKDITEHVKALKFDVVGNGKYTAQLGEEKDEGTFTMNATKTPKELDIKPTGGPGKGKLVKAIYKLDGDALTVCYEHDPDKGVRPEKFESKTGTTLLLISYERMKK